MNELQAIVDAAADARRSGGPALLATVVRVRGSAYRRPGARMLLTPDGWKAGSISGGCLEGDILRKAWWRTRTGEAVIVVYDSTLAEDEDADFGEELSWGFGLGCNGVVEVLLERLTLDEPACPVAFIGECLRRHRSGVLATVIASEGEGAPVIGCRLLLHEGEDAPVAHDLERTELVARIEQAARESLKSGRSSTMNITLPGGGWADVFLEVVQPPTPLVLCGAGHDIVPLVRMAKEIGWHVTVVDPRPGIPPRPDRFPGADAVLSCDPADLPRRVALDARTFVAVMSHNVSLDAALLSALLPTPVRYIGALGPRRRTERLLDYLRQRGEALTGLDRLHGPIGLDLGADSPETIALSILAEMQAVFAGCDAGALRNRETPIHREAHDGPRTPSRNSEPVECALTTSIAGGESW